MSLDITKVSVTFGKHQVLDELTIPRIFSGEMVALIGKNGAGKSTLLRQMTTLLRHHPAHIQYCERPLTLHDIGYLPQDHRISACITVIELLITTLNIDSGSLLAKKNSAETGLALLKEMGILHLANKSCTDLSGGESQMVGLAQAIINQPKVLLLDEPTSALDMQNQLRLLNYVQHYAKTQGACVLMVIHDLNLAIQYADKIAALHQGKLFAYDSPNNAITSQLIWDLFDVDSHIIMVEQRPVVVMKHQQAS
ncbi:iron ABC transporter [Photobacterium jeanii]|uniref:Iron ABC transporter n=1 Tax=Photobacterium jeanii TaxID=858640 RepID=A0A178K183_9GAMM|nr:ABC transporter ATP-binding protein [Photobacterium jeanii]OAN11089.1 iron ABC transporter [Photobacterium jeanii]PST90603.1 ABC transporter ATP-binding protein [Photobacterium jeanii]